jgi:putative transposase
MRKLKFDEGKIALILRQPGEGTTVKEVCRSAGITRQTYYRWRAKYGALTSTEIQRMRRLEDENVRLRKLVAYFYLGKDLLHDVLQRRA